MSQTIVTERRPYFVTAWKLEELHQSHVCFAFDPTGLPSQPIGSSSHSRAGDSTLVCSRNPLPDVRSKHALLSHIHPSVLSGLIVPASCDGAQLCSRHRGHRYQRVLYPRPAWATVGDCSLKK